MRTFSDDAKDENALLHQELAVNSASSGRPPQHDTLGVVRYPKGIKVSDAEMTTFNIKGDTFHPEWNYTISPRGPT